jgi:hypothetical protein
MSISALDAFAIVKGIPGEGGEEKTAAKGRVKGGKKPSLLRTIGAGAAAAITPHLLSKAITGLPGEEHLRKVVTHPGTGAFLGYGFGKAFRGRPFLSAVLGGLGALPQVQEALLSTPEATALRARGYQLGAAGRKGLGKLKEVLQAKKHFLGIAA